MTEARTFDWQPRHDPRSLAYPVQAVLARQPRSYTWPLTTWNDQGRQGACVGFAWSHEMAAAPVRIPTDNAHAQAIYEAAQRVDEYEGEAYSGTSVLAGAKVVKASGHMDEYRWAFGLDDVVATVGAYGPVVLGIPWHEDMFEPDKAGWIHATGDVAGGHAILARGVNLTGRYVTLHNSWGRDWGQDGTCRIGFGDLGKLLNQDGEACVPTARK